MFETQIRRQRMFMPGESRGIYILIFLIFFCLSCTNPATLKWEVYSLLKRIAALPLGMPAKHCKSFRSLFTLQPF